MKNTQHDPLYSDFFELNFVKDQDEVEVEGATVKLHWTPGHAKDHLALYLKEEDSLFSGDCVLGEGTVVFEDLLTYLQSLNKITALNSKRLYPGHGPVVTDPVEKVNEYIDKRMSRERQIVEALSRIDGGYLTSMEIVKITYNVSRWWWMMMMMMITDVLPSLRTPCRRRSCSAPSTTFACTWRS